VAYLVSRNGSAGVAIGHTGTKRCPVTGDMFGVTNSTCGDSPICPVIAALLWVKCPSRARRTRNILDYEKARRDSPEITYITKRSFRRSGSGRKWRRGPTAAPRWAGLAPVRPGFVAACMVKSPDGGVASGAGKPGPVGHPEPDKGNIFPMAEKWLGGGARRVACLAGRESDRVLDLPFATFSNNSCVESNIFGFVMT
jgi:hypothetical protein